MSRQRHNQNMLSTTTPSLSKDEALVCTREKDKFLRFARLIMVGCNDLFRELFNSLCPPEMLPGKVNSLVEELPRLNQHERKCLYPSTTGRCVTSDDFDISLLFKLLKVIGLEQPDGGWDKLPKKTDHKISDELVRIKYYRDEICHESYNKEISNDLFLELWEYIKGTMIGIAECLPRGSEWWELRIDEFSRAPLTLAEEELAEELNQWYLNDLDVKKLLLEFTAEIKANMKKLLKGMFNFFLNNSNIGRCDNPPQCAKKVVSDSPRLVDFAIGLVSFVLNLPQRQVLFWGEIQITEGL